MADLNKTMPQFDTELRQEEARRFRLTRAGILDDIAHCNNGHTGLCDGEDGGTLSLSCPHNDSGQGRPAVPDEAGRAELETTGVVFGLAPGMSAEDYFETVWLDTVRLGMRGILLDLGVMEALHEWAEAAEHASLISTMPVLVEICGVEWEVKPRGSQFYHILLLDGRGNVIETGKRNPEGKHPEVMVRIGKEWCKELGVQGISDWLEELRGYLHLALHEVYVSQLEICVDVPFSFDVQDVIGGRWRGYSTRQSGKQNRFSTLPAPTNKSSFYLGTDGSLVAWSNSDRNGNSAAHAMIYNKAADVARTQDSFYMSLAESLGLDLEEDEWWRVEGRFTRETLLSRGLGSWESINDYTILALWRWFTCQYIVFVDEPGQKRTDRAGVLDKWAVVQSVSAGVEPIGRKERLTAQVASLLPQAAGCIARELVERGCKFDDGWTEAVINDVLEVGYARLEDAAPLMADAIIKRIAVMRKGFDTDPEDMLLLLRDEVKKRVAKRPHSPRESVPVFATEDGLRGGLLPMFEATVKLTVSKVKKKLPLHLQGAADRIGGEAVDALLNTLWR